MKPLSLKMTMLRETKNKYVYDVEEGKNPAGVIYLAKAYVGDVPPEAIVVVISPKEGG